MHNLNLKKDKNIVLLETIQKKTIRSEERGQAEGERRKMGDI
jgi:hypothetical protein